MDLAQRSCGSAPCRLSPSEAAALQAAVPEWTIEAGDRLTRSWQFADFVGALAFVNAVGAEAETQSHHPDIELGWGRARLTFTTHDLEGGPGLTESDFILAARIDALPATQTR